MVKITECNFFGKLLKNNTLFSLATFFDYSKIIIKLNYSNSRKRKEKSEINTRTEKNHKR